MEYEQEHVKEKPKYDGSFNSIVACVAAKYGSVNKRYNNDEKIGWALQRDFRNWENIGTEHNIFDLGEEIDAFHSRKQWTNPYEHALAFRIVSLAGKLHGYLEHHQEDKLDIYQRYFEFGQKNPKLWRESLL